MKRHGIDEAGYGPLLGPLVLARADFEQSGARKGLRILKSSPLEVGDSKRLLSRRHGLATMEACVLGFYAAAYGSLPGTLTDWLALARVDNLDASLDQLPWYRERALSLPLFATLEECQEAQSAFAKGRVFGAKVQARGIGLKLISVPQYNDLVRASGNKHESLFALVCELIEEALRQDPDSERNVAVDKLGGRSYYGDKLALAFPFRPITKIEESRRQSSYSCEFDSAVTNLSFLMKGEDRRPEIGLASMCAKYTREVMMTLLNRYFLSRHPALRGTAGYYEDGHRFLQDLARFESLTPALRKSLVRIT